MAIDVTRIFSVLCCGKAILAYTKPKQWKQEKSEGLRGQGIRSSLLILNLTEGNLQGLGKEEAMKFHKLHVLGMNGDLWNRVCRVDSETWNGCEREKLLVFLTHLRRTEIIM